ncbi:hypothetical protein CspHIS471_0408530 [Cutaneotrichosporon sp. HIS471]|nr:hypothetical protein CspHIS471_0408530 [Cutaneotrichosporon sp. HIS471]
MNGKRPNDAPADPASPKRQCHGHSMSLSFPPDERETPESTRRGAVDLGILTEAPSYSLATPSSSLSSPNSTIFSPFASFSPGIEDKKPEFQYDFDFDIAAGSPRWPTIPLPPCEDESTDPGAPPPWPLPALPLTLNLSALTIDDDDDALSTASLDSESEAGIWEAASLLLLPRARRRAMSAPLRPGIVWDTRERGRGVAGGEE